MSGQEQERLSAAQRSKIRRLTAPKEIGPDEEEGGELNIIPFLDIVVNVLMFVLATITVSFTATMETSPPKAGGGGRAAEAPTLGLAVLVVGDGFSVKARGGNVAPGCSNDSGIGAGLAVPKNDRGYDFEALKGCACRLKQAATEFQSEMQVTISANPNVPFQVVASTMDAVRNITPDQARSASCSIPQLAADKTTYDLFPEVNFGLAR